MSHKIKQVFFSFFYGNKKWIEYTKYLSIIFHNTLLVVYGIKIILFLYILGYYLWNDHVGFDVP